MWGALLPASNGMKYGKLFGWGVVIYSVIYLTWSGLVIYGLQNELYSRLISITILIFMSAIAGRSLHFSSWKDILPYSLAWAVIIAVIDGLLAVPYAGWAIYSDLGVWVSYILVAVVPLFFKYDALTASDKISKNLT